MPFLSTLNLPKLDEKSSFTKKEQKELANTLAVFKTAGSKKNKKNITEWGVNRHQVLSRLFYMYLFSKYGNSCPIFTGYGNFNIALSLNIYEDKETKITKEIQDYLSQVDSCLGAGKSIVICPVRLIFTFGVHANLLIFRKEFKSIEVFEPHGKHFRSNSIDSERIFQAYRLVTDTFNKERKYDKYSVYLSDVVCPHDRGFQSLEGMAWLRKEKIEGEGYCSVWSMFMCELILMNPSMSTSQVISEALKLVNYETKGNNNLMGEYLLNLIRGYTTYITRRVEKYFTLIFGESRMIAIRNGNKKPNEEEVLLANKMFDAYVYVSNKLALVDFLSLDSLEEYVRKNKFMFTENHFNRIIMIINAMRDEKYGKYSEPGHHTPGMINSIVMKNACPKGKIRNQKGNCVKPRSKTQKNTVKNKQPALKSCPAGKERNPKTGRCRKIQPPKKNAKTKKLTIDTSHKKVVRISTPNKNAKPLKPTLKSCPAGKERNPKTGRCRKIQPPKKNAKTKKLIITCPAGCMIDPNYKRT